MRLNVDDSTFKLAFDICAQANGAEVYIDHPNYQQRLKLADEVVLLTQENNELKEKVKRLEEYFEHDNNKARMMDRLFTQRKPKPTGQKSCLNSLTAPLGHNNHIKERKSCGNT